MFRQHVGPYQFSNKLMVVNSKPSWFTNSRRLQKFIKFKKISRDYIVGFTDGEGCFSLHISRHKKRPFGLCFTPSWSVSQNSTSENVLQDIKSFFNCGFIRPDRKTSNFEVRDLENLQKKNHSFFQKESVKNSKKSRFPLVLWNLQFVRKRRTFKPNRCPKINRFSIFYESEWCVSS